MLAPVPPEGDARGGYGDSIADGLGVKVAPVAPQVTLDSTGVGVSWVVAVARPS